MKKNKAHPKEVSHAKPVSPATPQKPFGVWKGKAEVPAQYLGRVLAADPKSAERTALDQWNVKKVFVRELGEREFPKGRNFGFHPNRGVQKENPVWSDWQRRLHEGIRVDNQRLAAMRSPRGTEDTMSKEGKTTEKKSEKKAAAKPETTRQNWNGHGMCEIIRFCGKKGFGKEKTAKIVEAMGLEANPATINIQLRKGVKGENVPELSKDHRSEFNAIADDIPNDPKPAKKAKKADGAKSEKGGKTASKKSDKKKVMKKHDEEAQAEADSADEEEDVEVDEEVEEEVEA